MPKLEEVILPFKFVFCQIRKRINERIKVNKTREYIKTTTEHLQK